jgi:cystathionine beta-lyase
MWVADMDFPAPPCVIDALTERSRHGIFGYSDTKADYFDAVAAWFSTRHRWAVEPEWLVKTPGVVFALNVAIRAYTNAGDAVMIQPPVYYPFSEAVKLNGRRLIENRLVYEAGRYSIDFDDFEAKIVRNSVKLFILCSPHNPVGRVCSPDELTRLGEICVRHNVIIVADEIHQDFVYQGHTHTVFASLSPEIASRTITCTAPSKTFNLAGLQIANIFISEPNLRNQFVDEYERSGFSQVGTMGIVACRAAYQSGAVWLDELRKYLLGNSQLMRRFLSENLPQVKYAPQEGTYLAWLDFTEFGLSDAELRNIITNRAKLWLDDGTMFGSGGSGFERLNFACPKSVLLSALERLAIAFSGL